MADNKEYLKKDAENGSINISEEVLAVIAATAAGEVEGVQGLASNIGAEFAERLGKKNLSKGVKLAVSDEGVITVDVFVLVKYGCTVTQVAKNIQQSVLTAIESMTGLTVDAVNVHISGVSF